MNLTKNFELNDFLVNRWATPAEQKRIFESVTDEVRKNIKELAENLQVLSDSLGNPDITINIGFRPEWWELARRRSGKSKHVLGMAADIVIAGMTPFDVAEKIKALIKAGKMKAGGLKAYATFTHYDIRGVNARW